MSKHGPVKIEVEYVAVEPSTKGKRGRKKKNAEVESSVKAENEAAKQELITDHMPVVKKKRKIDRFNGMPEEEILLKTLPDRLAHNLDILIIGINPGLFAAYIGHHYAGPGNHFWKCLYLSGLVPEPMNCYDDIKLQQFGIGFTNICARTSRGSADLKKKEIEEGGQILIEKLKEYKPKIAVFNGKGIYEVFSGSKKIIFGKQPGLIEGTNTIAYVMPSSSARCSQLPRAVDKVPFYEALRRLRDYMVGRIPHLDESEVTFPSIELKTAVKKEAPVKNGETEGVGVPDAGSQKRGGRQGDGTSPVDKKAAKTCPKGKGKKLADTPENTKDIPSAVETTHSSDNQLVSSQPCTCLKQENPQDQNDIHHRQPNNSQVSTPSHLFQPGFTNPGHPVPGLPSSANGAFTNPFSTVDFTALRPAGLAGSMQPLHGFSTTSQDFMSGFYAGSQPFGMVGFPNAVASQQQEASTTGNPTGEEPVKIKSEPVDLH